MLVADDWLFARMRRAVDKVENRMRRASRALEEAHIQYAIIGGNAIAAWVATVDEAAVRNTRDVDLMLSRADFDSARDALEAAGFTHRRSGGLTMFLDTPESKALDAVHIIFVEESFGQPALSNAVPLRGVKILDLEDLVKIKLSVWRRKDQVHVEDLIQLGLVDETWVSRLPEDLAARLRYLLDNPE